MIDPIVATTRRDKAVQLWAMMKDGPEWEAETMTAREATLRFRIWAEAWAMPLLAQLVPEFRHPEGPR